MAKVLFVNGQSDRHWVETLRKAAHNLGKTLVFVSHKHVQEHIQNYELVILDSESIGKEDLTAVVQRVHTSYPEVRIVVISSSPHWKEARQTLLAGATDYVRKTDDIETISRLLHGDRSTLTHLGHTFEHESKGAADGTHYIVR